MPRYRVVNSPTFANGHLSPVGEEIEFAGWPGSSLEPADSVATRIKEFYAAHRNDRSFPKAPSLSQFADPQPAATEQPVQAVLVPSTEPKPAPEPKQKKRPGRKPAVKEQNDG